MGILDMFRRPAPIADRDALMQFIDTQSAFLGQKGVFEYSRARAGPFGNVLFKDKGFLAAVEISRWLAYPLALMMVGEAVEGTLRRHAGSRSDVVRRGFAQVMLAVFDRYPVPAGVDAVAWQESRAELENEFGGAALHPLRRVIDVPARYVDRYVALMPIHENLRGLDGLTIHNYLRANLAHAHDLFERRADVAALIGDLTGHD